MLTFEFYAVILQEQRAADRFYNPEDVFMDN